MSKTERCHALVAWSLTIAANKGWRGRALGAEGARKDSKNFLVAANVKYHATRVWHLSILDTVSAVGEFQILYKHGGVERPPRSPWCLIE